MFPLGAGFDGPLAREIKRRYDAYNDMRQDLKAAAEEQRLKLEERDQIREHVSTLRAENERLREALQGMVDLFPEPPYPGDGSTFKWKPEIGQRYDAAVGALTETEAK